VLHAGNALPPAGVGESQPTDAILRLKAMPTS
jgi:hypothetical protein